MNGWDPERERGRKKGQNIGVKQNKLFNLGCTEQFYNILSCIE